VTITVVIATRNRAALLHATLEQLRRQQYEPDDEVIVVDNASSDETAEVIARAADGFPVRLHQLSETAEGKTPALNAGLAAARGDVLALTDDDVLVGEHWIRDIRSAFGRSTLDLAGGRVDPRWERTPPRWLVVEGADSYEHMASPLALLHYGARQDLGQRAVLGSNMAFRRRVLQALGGFAPEFNRRSGNLLSGEDHDFCERAVAAGFQCEYLPELHVRHWVPAERVRLRYYLRWFYSSGVTQAMLDQRPAMGRDPASRVGLSRHYLRRLLTAPVSVLWRTLRGQLGDAASAAIDGALAAGYLVQGTRNPDGATRSAPRTDIDTARALAATHQPGAFRARGKQKKMENAR
jgi:glycosyltransferase involved in cell wall biosynthesis